MTGEAILGVVMALMIVCRERVDRYMTWVSGENVSLILSSAPL